MIKEGDPVEDLSLGLLFVEVGGEVKDGACGKVDGAPLDPWLQGSTS